MELPLAQPNIWGIFWLYRYIQSPLANSQGQLEFVEMDCRAELQSWSLYTDTHTVQLPAVHARITRVQSSQSSPKYISQTEHNTCYGVSGCSLCTWPAVGGSVIISLSKSSLQLYFEDIFPLKEIVFNVKWFQSTVQLKCASARTNPYFVLKRENEIRGKHLFL